MNKKFSTLMMGGMLLAVPSLVSAQSSFMLNGKPLQKVDFGKTQEYGNVLIIRDCDGYGEISADDVILIATKNALGEITYKSVSFNEEKDAIVDNEAEAIWTLEEQNAPDGGWYYGLVSKNTERYLTVDADGTSYSIVKTVGNSNDKLTQKALDEAETKFRSSYFFTGKSTDGIPDRLAKDNNDNLEDAKRLVKLLKGMLAHVNLIPINKIQDGTYIQSTNENILKFRDYLNKNGITATVRRELGSDIDAACGQLRRKNLL